jgi:hypothetical protein
MVAIINAVLRATETRVDDESLNVVAMFCVVGLAVSLIVAGYGVDVSWAFF